jgi:hypothetical protein
MIMKNKHGKGTRPGNVVIVEQIEYRAGDRCAWLAGALGIDENTRLYQARAIASEIFLQTRLFPLIEGKQRLDEATVIDLLVGFKQSRDDLDVQFEMAQVMARLLGRFQCHLIDESDNSVPLVSDSLEREMELFIALSELDFEIIDVAVQDRLHSE